MSTNVTPEELGAGVENCPTGSPPKGGAHIFLAFGLLDRDEQIGLRLLLQLVQTTTETDRYSLLLKTLATNRLGLDPSGLSYPEWQDACATLIKTKLHSK